MLCNPCGNMSACLLYLDGFASITSEFINHVGFEILINARLEASLLSLILEANICMAFDADGPDAPVHAKISGGFLKFDIPLLVFQYIDGLMLIVIIRFASYLILGIQILGIRIKHFHIKNALLKIESKKPIALISSRALSSVVVVLTANVSPCHVWRHCSASTSSQASLSKKSRGYHFFFCAYGHLLDKEEHKLHLKFLSKFVCWWPINGISSKSRAIRSLNFPSVKSKWYLFNGNEFGQLDTPFSVNKSREYASLHDEIFDCQRFR